MKNDVYIFFVARMAAILDFKMAAIVKNPTFDLIQRFQAILYPKTTFCCTKEVDEDYKFVMITWNELAAIFNFKMAAIRNRSLT